MIFTFLGQKKLSGEWKRKKRGEKGYIDVLKIKK
jgi:hypothetical protein